MVGADIPITDQRALCLTRKTKPEFDLKLLPDSLKLTLPAQPPPKITTAGNSLQCRPSGVLP
jgi:hypothetical protein